MPLTVNTLLERPEPLVFRMPRPLQLVILTALSFFAYTTVPSFIYCTCSHEAQRKDYTAAAMRRGVTGKCHLLL
jgi:hypothetical protein